MADDATSGAVILRDQTPPTASASGTIKESNATPSVIQLAWSASTDEMTTQSNLQYKVVYSRSDDISTVTTAESNGTVVKNWTANITTATAEGLNANTEYYFNVLVKDEAGNVSVYTSVALKTKAPFAGDESTTTTTEGVPVLVNGEERSIGTATTSTDAQGKHITTVTVDNEKLDEILKASGEKAVVTISITTGTDVAAGVLSGEVVGSMQENGATMVIRTENAAYTLPASEIDINNISQQFGENVTLADIEVTVSIAEPTDDTVSVLEDAAESGGFSLVVPAVEFSISCSYNGTTVDISSFNAYVERMIAIPDGVDPAKITTAIVVDEDKTIHPVPTSIIEIGGKYYAKINSLTNSTYSVIYNPVSFTDVASHWAKDAINDMGSRMVVTGMGDGSYEPDRSITRAEFAAIMVRAMGLTKSTAESGFGDISLTDWFNGYVGKAAEYGLITGYSASAFGPKDTITREQAMTMLARAMKITGLSVRLTDSEVSALLAGYTDGAVVSDYAKASVAACIKTGVVTGSSATTISPKASVTRAEVAVMLQRLLQKSGLI